MDGLVVDGRDEGGRIGRVKLGPSSAMQSSKRRAAALLACWLQKRNVAETGARLLGSRRRLMSAMHIPMTNNAAPPRHGETAVPIPPGVMPNSALIGR